MPRKEPGAVKARAAAAEFAHITTQRLLDEIGNALIDGRLTDWAKGFSRDIRSLACGYQALEGKGAK